MAEFTYADMMAVLAPPTNVPAPAAPASVPPPESKTPPKESKRAPKSKKKEAGSSDSSDDEGDEDRRMLKVARLKQELKNYQEHAMFGPKLKEKGFDFAAALRKKKPRELEKELKRVNRILAKSGGASALDMAAEYGLRAIELGGKGVGAQLDGLTRACFQDEGWKYTFERVKMKYGGASTGEDWDPLLMLALATGKAGVQVHMTNQTRSEMKPLIARLDEPLPPNQQRAENAQAPPPATTPPVVERIPGADAPGRLDAEGRPIPG